MVTDLIKIPCVRNLLFRDHLHSYADSILNITSQNIIISYEQINGDWKEIWVRDSMRHSSIRMILSLSLAPDFLYEYRCDSKSIRYQSGISNDCCSFENVGNLLF